MRSCALILLLTKCCYLYYTTDFHLIQKRLSTNVERIDGEMRKESAKLKQEERDDLYRLLSSEQKEFVKHHVKRGKKTKFANVMAEMKGAFLPEETEVEEIERFVDDWILDNYIDNGEVSPDTPCECGRPLRYQFIIKHIKTGEMLRLGKTHFREHTNFSPDIVRKIIQGFYEIDYEWMRYFNEDERQNLLCSREVS